MGFLDRVDGFARKIERFVAGKASADPLYLTNRTAGQKLRVVLLLGTPVLVAAVLMALALNNFFDSPPSAKELAAAARPKEPTGEITAKVLPNIDKEITSDYS